MYIVDEDKQEGQNDKKSPSPHYVQAKKISGTFIYAIFACYNGGMGIVSFYFAFSRYAFTGFDTHMPCYAVEDSDEP